MKEIYNGVIKNSKQVRTFQGSNQHLQLSFCTAQLIHIHTYTTDIPKVEFLEITVQTFFYETPTAFYFCSDVLICQVQKSTLQVRILTHQKVLLHQVQPNTPLSYSPLVSLDSNTLSGSIFPDPHYPTIAYYFAYASVPQVQFSSTLQALSQQPNSTTPFQLKNDYLQSKQLVVCPILTYSKESSDYEVEVTLPSGNWYYFWTKELYEGELSIRLSVPLGEVPIFVRAGLVFEPRTLSEPSEKGRSLHVFYTQSAFQSDCYDAVSTTITRYTTEGDYDHFRLECHASVIQQAFPCQLEVHGLPFEVPECLVDGKSTPFVQSEDTYHLVVLLQDDFKEIRFEA